MELLASCEPSCVDRAPQLLRAPRCEARKGAFSVRSLKTHTQDVAPSTDPVSPVYVEYSIDFENTQLQYSTRCTIHQLNAYAVTWSGGQTGAEIVPSMKQVTVKNLSGSWLS